MIDLAHEMEFVREKQTDSYRAFVYKCRRCGQFYIDSDQEKLVFQPVLDCDERIVESVMDLGS